MAKGYFNLLALMVLSSLLIGSQTAEWQIRYHNPNFPGKCTISPGLVLNGGVSIKDPTHECRQIVCGSDGMTLFHSCGVSDLPKSCRFGNYTHPELPYPQCCSRQRLCF
ncbi:uncharacterized protein LOC108163522 isoform X2 [Drosophila miranda]|uniref:Uncharacterized protein isoform X1 n=1 Tax=Drosophila pseudoobscura pseudoobscura TaxID=46245 RepID=A0A6I8W0J3_DROPS|nr:uncharacterized protein LOC108163522 isoform X2 [Drosophila miranda]XP_026844728.1 uncharacterized protein LOC113565788 isoform X2 [Drosophila persimilis]XP_033236274.1 uncharacterized protein LOC26531978 isoform X1 [Drosophila pseudoobscura]XP_033249620.1 uncharacterized protein LOC108163522 isoform X2 [Drosophila miranda]